MDAPGLRELDAESLSESYANYRFRRQEAGIRPRDHHNQNRRVVYNGGPKFKNDLLWSKRR